MPILTLLGAMFIGGWLTLVSLTVQNEVRFEDKQIEEMKEFTERDKK